MAVTAEVAIAAMFLTVGPVADVLDHGLPSLGGWLVALASAPAVLAADTLDKRRRARRATE